MKKLIFSAMWVLSGLVGCQKQGDEPVKEPVDEPKPPASAELDLPAQNSACITGVAVTDSQSIVRFKWKAAVNATKYELQFKNLLTQEIKVRQADTTQMDVPLTINTPYSWWVVSRSDTNPDTAHSKVWKFYMAGAASVSYAPFPAEIIAPVLGQTISAVNGKVDLQWKGGDIDNDLMHYNIYIGTNSNSVPLYRSGLTHREGVNIVLADVPVNAATTYYWKVESVDSRGFSSHSELASFRVQ